MTGPKFIWPRITSFELDFYCTAVWKWLISFGSLTYTCVREIGSRSTFFPKCIRTICHHISIYNEPMEQSSSLFFDEVIKFLSGRTLVSLEKHLPPACILIAFCLGGEENLINVIATHCTDAVAAVLKQWNIHLCLELGCITVKWAWYNGRDIFFISGPGGLTYIKVLISLKSYFS